LPEAYRFYIAKVLSLDAEIIGPGKAQAGIHEPEVSIATYCMGFPFSGHAVDLATKHSSCQKNVAVSAKDERIRLPNPRRWGKAKTDLAQLR